MVQLLQTELLLLLRLPSRQFLVSGQAGTCLRHRHPIYLRHSTPSNTGHSSSKPINKDHSSSKDSHSMHSSSLLSKGMHKQGPSSKPHKQEKVLTAVSLMKLVRVAVHRGAEEEGVQIGAEAEAGAMSQLHSLTADTKTPTKLPWQIIIERIVPIRRWVGQENRLSIMLVKVFRTLLKFAFLLLKLPQAQQLVVSQ